MMFSSDHDTRNDIASELWTVAELLDEQDKIVQAIDARELAIKVVHAGADLDAAMWKLGFYENLLD